MLGKLLRRFAAWNRKRLREIDMEHLWPCCKEQARRHGMGLDHAKAAFASHAFHDPAWYKDYTREELIEYISDLV